MGQVLMAGGGGGGIGSDEVTALKAQVLAGYTALTNDSDDEIATGTLPLASVMADKGGSLPLASVMADKGGSLPLSSVLSDNGGTMPNRGAVSYSLPVNGSYTIPNGYHNGNGVVNQSITVNYDSGNTNLDSPGASKSYAAGYYPNAHGAYVNISWYTDLS